MCIRVVILAAVLLVLFNSRPFSSRRVWLLHNFHLYFVGSLEWLWWAFSHFPRVRLLTLTRIGRLYEATNGIVLHVSVSPKDVDPKNDRRGVARSRFSLMKECQAFESHCLSIYHRLHCSRASNSKSDTEDRLRLREYATWVVESNPYGSTREPACSFC